MKCVPHQESGRKVSIEGQKWFAQGTGADAQYFSVAANLTNGDMLLDGIIYKSKDGSCPPPPGEGMFSAFKNVCRAQAGSVHEIQHHLLYRQNQKHRKALSGLLQPLLPRAVETCH